MGASLKSIVAGLLNTKVEDRLGVNTPVLEHPWLDNIDWDKMQAGRYLVCPRLCNKSPRLTDAVNLSYRPLGFLERLRTPRHG